MTDDDKLSYSHSLVQGRKKQGKEQPGDSEEEAEFEAIPRTSRWGGNEEQELHYLLPLKGKHGQLIHQEPMVVPAPTDGESTVEIVREGSIVG